MHRVWHLDSGDYGSAARARKEFAAYIRQAAAANSDCHATVLIFGELVANALTHGRGPVQACVGPGAPYAILWVEDAGDGFALERVRKPVRSELSGRGILIATSLARSIRGRASPATAFASRWSSRFGLPRRAVIQRSVSRVPACI